MYTKSVNRFAITTMLLVLSAFFGTSVQAQDLRVIRGHILDRDMFETANGLEVEYYVEGKHIGSEVFEMSCSNESYAGDLERAYETGEKVHIAAEKIDHPITGRPCWKIVEVLFI